MSKVKKAIAAALGALATGVAAAYAGDSAVSTEEWLYVLSLTVAAVYAVYQVRNTP